MASADPPDAPARKKFVPLENNPEVMTSLLHRLGLSPSLAFTDVYSVWDRELLSFVPRPAHALLLVFPMSARYEAFRRAADAGRGEYGGAGAGEDVVWYRQTIGNACGLIGLLHAACNGAARAHMGAGTPLDRLLRAALPLPPPARARLLEETEALEEAHRDAAARGDTAPPSADADLDLHYVCFVRGRAQHPGRLYELDGRRKGPIDLGELAPDEDVLSERALDKGVRAFLKREEQAAGGGDLRFSLLALVDNSP